MTPKVSPGAEQGYVVNKRGQRIYTEVFLAPQGVKPSAVLCWEHGLGEHVGRYEKVFMQFADAGVVVLTMDAHGHGKSEPLEPAKRAYIGSFSHVVDDFEYFIQETLNSTLGEQLAKLPLFIGGHSTGGLIAAHTALRTQQQWRGMLLHSPSLDVEWTWLTRVQSWIGRILSYLIPAARVVTAVRLEDMSQDPEVLAKYRADPLITKGNVCARTAAVILDAFNELNWKAKLVTVPVYIAHGTNDRCTSLPASRRFIRTISSKDATLWECPGGYHELLMGPEWRDCTDRMIAWIKKHT